MNVHNVVRRKIDTLRTGEVITISGTNGYQFCIIPVSKELLALEVGNGNAGGKEGLLFSDIH